jgi:hypothetical protein
MPEPTEPCDGHFHNLNVEHILYVNGSPPIPDSLFVPGLHGSMGVHVLDNHMIMHEAIFADIGTNTYIWEYDTDNSAAIVAFVGTDALHGGFKLTTGTTNGHQTAIATAGTNYKCTVGKPWWIKTRFNLDDHDAAEFFFGLTEQAADVDSFYTDTVGASKDRIGFLKLAHNVDAVTFACCKNTGGTATTAFDSVQTYDADLSVVSYGIYWDGIDSIRFYANKVATTETPGDMVLIHTYSTAAGIPDDSNLRLCLMIETGKSGAINAIIEYIKGAYTK